MLIFNGCTLCEPSFLVPQMSELAGISRCLGWFSWIFHGFGKLLTTWITESPTWKVSRWSLLPIKVRLSGTHHYLLNEENFFINKKKHPAVSFRLCVFGECVLFWFFLGRGAGVFFFIDCDCFFLTWFSKKMAIAIIYTFCQNITTFFLLRSSFDVQFFFRSKNTVYPGLSKSTVKKR